MAEPSTTRPKPDRRPLLDRPELKPQERLRIGRAAAVLLGWGLVATAALGLLALWHLVRRGRVLRGNLAPPRPTALPDDVQLPPSLEPRRSNGTP